MNTKKIVSFVAGAAVAITILKVLDDSGLKNEVSKVIDLPAKATEKVASAVVSKKTAKKISKPVKILSDGVKTITKAVIEAPNDFKEVIWKW